MEFNMDRRHLSPGQRGYKRELKRASSNIAQYNTSSNSISKSNRRPEDIHRSVCKFYNSNPSFCTSNRPCSLDNTFSYFNDILDRLSGANYALRILQNKFSSCFRGQKKNKRQKLNIIIEIDLSTKTLLSVVEDLNKELNMQNILDCNAVNNLKHIINVYESKLNGLVQQLKCLKSNQNTKIQHLLNYSPCYLHERADSRELLHQHKADSTKNTTSHCGLYRTSLMNSLPKNTSKARDVVLNDTNINIFSSSLVNRRSRNQYTTRREFNETKNHVRFSSEPHENHKSNRYRRKTCFTCDYNAQPKFCNSDIRTHDIIICQNRNSSYFRNPQYKLGNCRPIFIQNNVYNSINGRNCRAIEQKYTQNRQANVRNDNTKDMKAIPNAYANHLRQRTISGESINNIRVTEELIQNKKIHQSRQLSTNNIKVGTFNNKTSKKGNREINQPNMMRGSRMRTGWSNDRHMKRSRRCCQSPPSCRVYCCQKRSLRSPQLSCSKSFRKTRNSSPRKRTISKYYFKPARNKQFIMFSMDNHDNSRSMLSINLSRNDSPPHNNKERKNWSYSNFNSFKKVSDTRQKHYFGKRTLNRNHKSLEYHKSIKNEFRYIKSRSNHHIRNPKNVEEIRPCRASNIRYISHHPYPLCDPRLCYKRRYCNKCRCSLTVDAYYCDHPKYPIKLVCRECKRRLYCQDQFNKHLPSLERKKYVTVDFEECPHRIRKMNEVYVTESDCSLEDDIRSFYVKESDIESTESSSSECSSYASLEDIRGFFMPCNDYTQPCEPREMRKHKSLKQLFLRKESKNHKRSYSYIRLDTYIKESSESVVEFELQDKESTHTIGTNTDSLKKESTSIDKIIKLLKTVGTNTREYVTKEQGIDSIPQTVELPKKNAFTNTENTKTQSIGINTLPQTPKEKMIDTATDPLLEATAEVQREKFETEPIYLEKISKQTGTEPVLMKHGQTETEPEIKEVKSKQTSYEKMETHERGVNTVPPNLKHANTSVEPMKTSSKMIQTSFIDTVKKPPQDEKQIQTVKKETQSRGVSTKKIKGREKGVQTIKKEPVPKGVNKPVSKGVNRDKTTLHVEEVKVTKKEPSSITVEGNQKNYESESELSMHLVFEKCLEDIYKKRCSNNYYCKPKIETHQRGCLCKSGSIVEFTSNICHAQVSNNNKITQHIQHDLNKSKIRHKLNHMYSKDCTNDLKDTEEDTSMADTFDCNGDYLLQHSFWRKIANKVKDDESD